MSRVSTPQGCAQLQGLIFDFDGTLVDSELELHLPAFNQAFADAGLPWHWDVPRYLQLLAVPGGRQRIRAWIETQCPDMDTKGRDTLATELHAAKNARIQQRLEQHPLTLRPGVRTLLTDAQHNGLCLGIASTAHSKTIESTMTQALEIDVWTIFDCIVGGNQVERVKPAPDVYLKALQQLQLDESRVIAIEDSQTGLAAARAAGLVTVISRNTLTRDEDFTGAALVLNEIAPTGDEATPDASEKIPAGRALTLEHLCALLSPGHTRF